MARGGLAVAGVLLGVAMWCTSGVLAGAHPELTVLDWRAYSNNKWSWFQGDGVHLTYEGAIAMATFLHDSILEGLSPLTVGDVEAPTATVGRPYDLTLSAAGGMPPYRWSES